MFFCVLFPLAPASADKYSLIGPVIKSGQRALEIGDVRPALVWVSEKDEDEIKEVFAQTKEVRKLGIEARLFADRYFLETLVRIHRRAQGLAFTGMKDIEEPREIILAADEALENGSVKALAGEIADLVSSEIEKRFDAVLVKAKHSDGSAEAGRDYAAAYIDYIRYMEKVHAAALGE